MTAGSDGARPDSARPDDGLAFGSAAEIGAGYELGPDGPHGDESGAAPGGGEDVDGDSMVPAGAADDTHRGAFGEFGATTQAFIDRAFRERIILVGASFPPHDNQLVDEHLDELARLIDKAIEIRDLAESLDCDTVVFDDELTPAQQFNLEKVLGRTAIDRTAVILDIFAQNASSLEGKAQVELALLRYRLPRLRGRGRAMSQQGAGIGTRGPGETQLEVDRRRLVRRIHKLEAQLRDVAGQRETQRKARHRHTLRHVVIVGYTNAGKSTLLNRLTDAGVLAEDRLFATLDPTTRRLALPGGESVLLTDTVGFVRKLPHQLVEAFKSTLEIANDADLIVHVVDASAVDPEAEIEAVHDVLRAIGADDRPELVAFNKCDLSPPPGTVRDRFDASVVMSAATGEGVDALLAEVARRLRELDALVTLSIPYDRGDIAAAAHRAGQVVDEVATDGALRVQVRLADTEIGRFEPWVVDGGAASD